MNTDEMFTRILNGAFLQISAVTHVDLNPEDIEASSMNEVKKYVEMGEQLNHHYYKQIREISEFMASQAGEESLISKAQITLKKDKNVGIKLDFPQDKYKGRSAGFVSMVLPSMAGKTQAAFALGSKVLYFPLLSDFNNCQEIYKPFKQLSTCLLNCAKADLVEMEKYVKPGQKIGKNFTRNIFKTHFENKKSFVIGFFDLMMESFPTEKPKWMEHFLTQRFKDPIISPKTMNEFNKIDYSRVLQYQVIFDEFLSSGSSSNDKDSSAFLRNMVRALDMPLIVMGTNSRMHNLFGVEAAGDSAITTPEFSVWNVAIIRLPPALVTEKIKEKFEYLKNPPRSATQDLFRFVSEEAKTNRPGMLTILSASLDEIIKEVRETNSDLASPSDSTTNDETSSLTHTTSSVFNLLEHTNEDEVLFDLIKKCAKKIRERKNTLVDPVGEKGQFDALLQAKVVKSSKQKEKGVWDTDVEEPIPRFEPSYVNEHLYYLARPDTHYSFDLPSFSEAGRPPAGASQAPFDEEVVPHICLFGKKSVNNTALISLKPEMILPWDENCVPLDFEKECLLHLSIYGLDEPSLLPEFAGLYEYLQRDFKESESNLSSKNPTANRTHEWKTGELLNKAVVIDSSHKKSSIRPLNFIDFFNNCIRGYHRNNNSNDEIFWSLNQETALYLERLFVPYLAKDNSLWPDSAKDLHEEYFGVGRCTYKDEQVDFIAEGLFYRDSSLPIIDFKEGYTFGNLVFEVKVWETLPLSELKNIIEKCFAIQFKDGPAVFEWLHKSEDQRKPLAIVVFSYQVNFEILCYLKDFRVDPYFVLDFADEYILDKELLADLQINEDRFGVVPFEAVQRALFSGVPPSKVPKVSSEPDKVPLFLVSSMFSGNPSSVRGD